MELHVTVAKISAKGFVGVRSWPSPQAISTQERTSVRHGVRCIRSIASHTRECRRAAREPRDQSRRTMRRETAQRFATDSPDSVSGWPRGRSGRAYPRDVRTLATSTCRRVCPARAALATRQWCTRFLCQRREVDEASKIRRVLQRRVGLQPRPGSSGFEADDLASRIGRIDRIQGIARMHRHDDKVA